MATDEPTKHMMAQLLDSLGESQDIGYGAWLAFALTAHRVIVHESES